MTCNNKKYKGRTSWNNGQGEWVFQWKDGHEEWKIKQGKKPFFRFYNPSTNAVIYCSYLMTTSEESTEEEPKSGDDSQSNDLISLSRFEILEWILKRVCSPLLIYILLFYDEDVDLDLDREVELLDMESEDKLQPVSQ